MSVAVTTDVCARAYPADHTLPVGASVSGLELLRQTLEVINAEAVVAGEDVAGQVTLEAVPVVAFRLPLLQPRHSREQVWVTPPSSPPTTAGEETRAGPPTGAPTNAGPADNTSDPSANLLKPVLHLQPADKNLTARTTAAPPEPEHSHAESNPVEELNQTCCKPRRIDVLLQPGTVVQRQRSSNVHGHVTSVLMQRTCQTQGPEAVLDVHSPPAWALRALTIRRTSIVRKITASNNYIVYFFTFLCSIMNECLLSHSGETAVTQQQHTEKK